MEFKAPLGPFGEFVERLLLERHMRRLLERQNRCIHQTAESDNEKWKDCLG